SVELAWIMPGTSSSTIFSHSGYHHSLPRDGVNGSTPPDTSGLMLKPTKPHSCTQRSISSRQFCGPTPGVCGNCPTGENCCGNSLQTRPIRSLFASVQYRLISSLPKSCPMPEARGENIRRLMPRSCICLIFPASDARISSSLMPSEPLDGLFCDPT